MQLARSGPLARLEQPDRKDLLVHKGRRVTLAQLERWELREPRVQLARRVPLVLLAQWGRSDLKVHKVSRGRWET